MGAKEQLRVRQYWTWHRRFGIVVALLVVILATTGLALNHTDALRLDERFVGAGWLLDLYGIEAPREVVAYAAGESRVALVGDRLYLNGAARSGLYGGLVGAVSVDDLVVVAAGGEVLIFTRNGDLVDRLGPESAVPDEIDAIGVHSDGSIVLTSDGRVYHASIQTLMWSAAASSGEGIRWSQPVALPSDELERLREDFRGQVLTWERVLLDVHSGRLAGGAGVLLMDAAAILLLLLAFTGTWLWFRRR